MSENGSSRIYGRNAGGSLWIVVGVAAFFVFMTMGVRQGFGLFLGPITGELDLSREVYALAIAIQNLLWGIFSPAIGAFADKYGVIRISIAGVLLYSVGLIVMAFGGLAGLFGGQTMIGIGMASAGTGVMLGAVGKAAPEGKRSLALGIATAAGSLGQFAVVQITQEFISAFEWKTTLVILSVAMLPLLAALLLFRKGSSGNTTSAVPTIEVLSRALRYRPYILLTTGFFVCGFQVVFISTHLPIFLEDGGLSPRIAGTALALIGLFNLLGTLIFGYLGGRFSKKLLLSAIYIGRSFVISGFLLIPLSTTSALTFGAVIGFLWLGTVPLTSGLVAVLFGVRNMAMLYGVTFFSHQAGSFLGAWLGGRIYESTGSYEIMWMIAIGAGLVAAMIHLPIRERFAPAPYRGKVNQTK